MTVKVRFQKLTDTASIPTRATPGSAGLDLYLAEDLLIYPNSTVRARTGLRVAIPEGFEGQVRPRSSLAAEGLVIPNSPGTIDSDYRGEVMVLLRNEHGMSKFYNVGERIAQLVIVPVPMVEVIETDNISLDTTRAEGGFGSSGR